MKKKKVEIIKMFMLVLFYIVLYPVTLISFKLFPYIKTNDTNIEIGSFIMNIVQKPITTTKEIIGSNMMIAFIIVQIIVLLVLFMFLHPKKRNPYEVVGKTNPVQGGAYWGEESEINAPKNVHLIDESAIRKVLKRSMRGENNG